MMGIGAVVGLVLAILPTAALAAGIEATVQWSKPVALVTCCSGVIARVSVQPGERAGADQVLLALEETPFASAVRGAEAVVTRRRLDGILDFAPHGGRITEDVLRARHVQKRLVQAQRFDVGGELSQRRHQLT